MECIFCGKELEPEEAEPVYHGKANGSEEKLYRHKDECPKDEIPEDECSEEEDGNIKGATEHRLRRAID